MSASTTRIPSDAVIQSFTVSTSGKKEATNAYIRSDYNPLAHFTPAVPVDKYGKATVKVKIPETVARYRYVLNTYNNTNRVWAVAVSSDGKSYGIGDSLITARLPMAIKIKTPKQLYYHDSCKLPIYVKNLTETPIQVR